MQPDRTEWAAVAAEAYYDQYIDPTGRNRRADDARIDYNPRESGFDWSSTLTPPGGDIPVLIMFDGMFYAEGDQGDRAARIEEMAEGLADVGGWADDMWRDVVAAIAEYYEEEENEALPGSDHYM